MVGMIVGAALGAVGGVWAYRENGWVRRNLNGVVDWVEHQLEPSAKPSSNPDSKSEDKPAT